MRRIFVAPFRRQLLLGRWVGRVLLGSLTFGLVSWSAPTSRGESDDSRLARTDDIVGMTTPHRQAMLSTVQPARIADVPVSEGAIVSKGQLLVALEDGVQGARVAVAKVEAESNYGIELAMVRLSHAERELTRLTKLNGQDLASSKEYDDAQTRAQTARLEVEVAKLQRLKAQAVYRRERELLDQYRIAAPFSGYIAKHLKHSGESVDHLEGIIELVQLDPIVVGVDCPLALAGRIVAGGSFSVIPSDAHLVPRDGVVTFSNRVADAASQTFKVKLTVANSDLSWPVGMKVVVRFSEERIAGGLAETSLPASSVSNDGDQ